MRILGCSASVRQGGAYRRLLLLRAVFVRSQVALLKWLELPPVGEFDIFCSGVPSPALVRWLEVATMSTEDEVTKLMRTVIAAKAQETARALEQQKLSPPEGTTQEGHADVGVPQGTAGGEGKGEGAAAEGKEEGKGEEGAESVTKGGDEKMVREVEAVKEACEARLKVLRSEGRSSVTVATPATGSNVTVTNGNASGSPDTVSNGTTASKGATAGEGGSAARGSGSVAAKANGTHKESEAPKGLGFGLKKGPAGSKARTSNGTSNSTVISNGYSAASVEKESELTRAVWNLEVRTLEVALERCQGVLSAAK